MITEMDRVILLEAMPEYRLEAGDIGTVIDVYADEYTVLFVRHNRRNQLQAITVDVAPYQIRLYLDEAAGV